MSLRDRFRDAGVTAEHIDGDTPNVERAHILERFTKGEVRVITNCQVLTYGWDAPVASCAVLARPTKSLVAYFQMVGRVLRIAGGKRDALVLDHGGVVRELGFVDEDIPWSLGDDKPVQTRKQERDAGEPKPITCGDCGATFDPAPECPQCGHEMGGRYAKAIEEAEAELAELDRKTKQGKNRVWTWAEKADFLAELRGIAMNRGYSDGWAAHKYRAKFGVWPNDARVKNVAPAQPSAQVLAFVKSQQIRYAKAQQKEAA